MEPKKLWASRSVGSEYCTLWSMKPTKCDGVFYTNYEWIHLVDKFIPSTTIIPINFEIKPGECFEIEQVEGVWRKVEVFKPYITKVQSVPEYVVKFDLDKASWVNPGVVKALRPDLVERVEKEGKVEL